MRSLYARIFLSFWVAMLLTGAALVALALTTENPRSEYRARERALRQLGRDLVWVYESRGGDVLAAEAARLEQSKKTRTYLFRGGEGPLVGPPPPPGIALLAGEAEATHEVQRRFGPDRLWLAVPVTDEYVLVAGLPMQSRVERLLSPRRLGMRVLVTLLFASVICFVLARSLTAPIRTLRAAARRVSEGDFAARVAPELGRRKDEIAELAHDFDVMAERIEALMRGQRRLVRDISHELRSPLARLNVALELARQRSGPEATGALDRIELEGERLNGLIGQLLALAALETGTEPFEQTPVALRKLLEEVIDDAAFEAQDGTRGLKLITDDDEIVVEGSEQMLRQAVENVVRNALRHAQEGEGLEISLGRRSEGEGSVAVIAVRDHGPGVPEEALPHLFEPFYRAAEARDRQTGGTGIGLAITERAVRLHGGTVTAVNAPGGGLRVELILPVQGPGESERGTPNL